MSKLSIRILVSLLTFFVGLISLIWLNFETISSNNFPSKIEKNIENTSQNIEITDDDKKEIIISILKDYKSNSRIFNESQKICLSTEYLPKSLIEDFPKIKGINPILMLPITTVQMGGKSVKESELKFDYVRFTDFKVKENKILISLITHFSGGNIGGATYEFEKVSGKWNGKAKDYFAAAS